MNNSPDACPKAEKLISKLDKIISEKALISSEATVVYQLGVARLICDVIMCSGISKEN